MSYIELISEAGSPAAECAFIKSFAVLVLESMGQKKWQMGLVITNNAGIRHYNRRWRHLDAVTDVLSFVQSDGEDMPVVPWMLKNVGDIVISLEKVKENAIEWKSSYEEELRRVIIHGILHLSGLDHPGDDYGSGMLRLQEEILRGSKKMMSDRLS